MPTLNLTLLADHALPLVRRLVELAPAYTTEPPLIVDLDPRGLVSEGLGVRALTGGLAPALAQRSRGPATAPTPQIGERGLRVLTPGRDLLGAYEAVLAAGGRLAGALNPMDALAGLREAQEAEFVITVADPTPSALQMAAIGIADDILLVLENSEVLPAELDAKVRLVQKIAQARGRLSANGLFAGLQGLTPPPSHWRLVHAIANGLGDDPLPDALREQWDALDAELGEAEHATVMIDIAALPHPEDEPDTWTGALLGLLGDPEADEA
jgi:hypothetical protein